MTRSAEPFVRVPRRLFDAMQRGELSPTSFAVLAVLVDEADRLNGTAAFTLARLADRLSWEWGTEWLRRQLVGLRADGWIAYESKPGQRKPYRIELRRAALLTSTASGEPRRDLHPTSTEPPPDLQLGNLHRTIASESRETAPEAESGDSATSNSRARAPGDGDERRREKQQQQSDSSISNTTSNASAEDDEPPEIAEALRDLAHADGHALNGPGRREVVDAYFEEPAGVLALIRDLTQRRLARAVRSGSGVLVSRIKSGDHRGAGELLRRDAPCPECETGAGEHTADCSLRPGAA